jgi:hypothetical protein
VVTTVDYDRFNHTRPPRIQQSVRILSCSAQQARWTERLRPIYRVIWLQCGSDDDDIIDAKSPSVKRRRQPIEQHSPKRPSHQLRGDTCLLVVCGRLVQPPLGGLLTRLAAIPIYT